MELMQASRQWMSRPDDERFTSLTALLDATLSARRQSRGLVVSTKQLAVEPDPADAVEGLRVYGANGHGYTPTHWSFGQLAQLAGGAPASYLRELPAPLAADCLNYGLQCNRKADEVGVLLRRSPDNENDASIVAATGPNYGRVWNADIAKQLVERFGDGVTGDWRVPGEFGKAIQVTKANTTLYASDRDMFVFLADEVNRVDMRDRRNGQGGSLARGFFVWNSEVGSMSFGVAMFLFDYVCCNRIVWGAQGYKEIRLRHTVSAPDKLISEVAPVLIQYQRASVAPIEATIAAAQAKRVDDVKAFLANRKFSRATIGKIEQAHLADEGRPMETLWDVTTGITAYARQVPFQDERVALERVGGAVLDLVAA